MLAMSLWSETSVDFMIVLPDQTRIATPPDLPECPSTVFYVRIARCHMPVHPFLNAADFLDPMLFGSLQCSWM
eukprot:15422768-Heterocapsa_arctica.AAC.1